MTICQVVLLVLRNIKTMDVVPADQHLVAAAKLVLNLVVNVTDGLLSSLQDLVEGEELSEAEPELINNLGGEGSVVYTEIKVS